MERKYHVAGLDCAEEVRALKETVGRLDGIERLDFDLLEGVMRIVSPAGDRPPDKAIIEAVRRAGLEARPLREGETAGHDDTDSRRARIRLCALSGLLLAAGLGLHWYLHGSIIDALTGGSHLENHVLPLPVLLLFAGATVAGGWFVFPKAWQALRRARADMNLLMTIAVIGAAGIGEWFEAAAVAFLFALSLVLESWSVGRARQAVAALMDLAPLTARYRCPHDGDILEKPVEAVPPGVTVLVRPGEKVPLDGVVTRGETSIDQAPITGESIPVNKKAGDEVFAGTINQEGAFEFRCTRAAADSTLARIIRMVEEARGRRARSEQWVETFARYYTPAMILFAMLVAIVPPLLLGASWIRWFYQALVMLVIACPCALVISTPVSIVAALAAAARSGILVKGGAFLEVAGRICALGMDKTGTLTLGAPEVRRVVPFSGHSEEEVLARAAALESESGHPIARAIRREAARRGLAPEPAANLRDIRGKGTEATIAGKKYWIGSHRFMHEKGAETQAIHQAALALEDAGHTLVALGSDTHVCGLVSVADRVRDDAREAVAALRKTGVAHIVMLTGDNEATARAVAEAVGIDEYRAGLLPEDKVAAVEDLGAAYGVTAMIGDGVNDAPAMAAASLGIAMGAAGTDAAIETADIALMADDLAKIAWLIRHSRRTLNVIRQNIVFALGVKLIFMALALAGVATLWMAIAADMGASLLVIFNALRLLRIR